MTGISTLIIIAAIMGGVFILIATCSYLYQLKSIKTKTAGDGQHGTARWASNAEIKATYKHIDFRPELWRSDPESRPKDQGIVVGCTTKGKQADNPKYYYYALQAARIPNLGYSRHFKVVKELMIRVYPRADQDQIVSILEKIDEVIEIRQAELLAIEQLVKSRFIEMFGDPVSNDKGWPHQAMDKVAPSSACSGDNSERVWLLNLDMVEAHTGRIIDYLYVDKAEVGTSTCGFDEGNVLYSKLRPYLNKVVVPTKKGYCTTELVPLRPNVKLNRQFLGILHSRRLSAILTR